MTHPGSPRPGAYDPWAHAQGSGLTIHYIPGLPHQGLYENGCILLRDGLTRRVERCVLSHEIVHAEHDDQPTRDHKTHARQERRADRIAAQRLISVEDLQDVQRLSEDPGMWCLELDVTAWILTARIQHLEEQPCPM